MRGGHQPRSIPAAAAVIAGLCATMTGIGRPWGQGPPTWATDPPSKEKVTALNERSYAIGDDQVDSSLHYARVALRMARALGDDGGLSTAYRRIGTAHWRKNLPDSALHYFRLSMDMDQRAGDLDGVASNAQKIARVYADRGQLKEAVDMNRTALSICRQTGNRRGESLSLSQLGGVQGQLGHLDDALASYFASLEINKELKDGSRIASGYQSIDLLYRDFEQYDKAEEYCRQFIDMARASGSDKLMAAAYKNMGGLYKEKGDHARFRSFSDSALMLYGKIGDERSALGARFNIAIADLELGDLDGAEAGIQAILPELQRTGLNTLLVGAHNNLGIIALRRNDLRAASDRFEHALEIARRSGDRSLQVEVLPNLADLRQKQGRLDEAIGVLRSYQAMRDSMINLKSTEQLATAEVREKYDTALRIKELQEHKVKLEMEQAQKARRTWQRNALLALAALLLAVLVLLYRNNQHIRRLRQQEQTLHEQRVNDLLKQQEIRSLDAMMQGQEKERERIAKDLHDRLGSMLSAIKLQFSALEGRIAEMESQQKEQYQRVFHLLDDAVTEVRRISHDMVRGTLTQFGLQGALEDLRSAIEVPGKLQVELNVFGLEQRLDQKLEIAVYRMVQEMVSNALKHARADHLSVQITRSAAMLNLIVEDNGRGFDPAAASEGMGMGNIRARAAEFGGSVQVDSKAGRGTSITVDIPLEGRQAPLPA